MTEVVFSPVVPANTFLLPVVGTVCVFFLLLLLLLFWFRLRPIVGLWCTSDEFHLQSLELDIDVALTNEL